MFQRVAAAVARGIRGIAAAIRARPRLFLAVTTAVFALDLFLPPVVLSLARKRVDYFTFNPWLSRLPEYLLSNEASVGRKVEFLLRVALFWFSADSPYGGVEWGYAVDTSDLLRFFFMSFLVGAYFTLWFYRRDQVMQQGWGSRISRQGGIVGALTSVLGLSTGPCSVMGCGAPVIPVIGLAFVGLSSGTLKLLAETSKIGTSVVLVAMTLGVAYFGWLVGANPGPKDANPSM